MAWSAGREGDREKAFNLNRQALAALIQMEDWPDAATVLSNMSGYVSDAEASSYLAQALWIAMRVGVPAEEVLGIATALVGSSGGAESEHAPLLGAAALLTVDTRGRDHPQLQRLRQQAGALLSATLAARDIDRETAPRWLEERGLLEPKRLLAMLDEQLGRWVDDWSFDRSVLAPASDRLPATLEPSLPEPPKALTADDELSPREGDPAAWRAGGLRSFAIDYFSGRKRITLWSAARLAIEGFDLEDEAFLTSLLRSVSLSAEEKANIIEQAEALTEEQFIELTRNLEEESEKFAGLPEAHADQLDALQDKTLLDWVELERDKE